MKKQAAKPASEKNMRAIARDINSDLKKLSKADLLDVLAYLRERRRRLMRAIARDINSDLKKLSRADLLDVLAYLRERKRQFSSPQGC